MGVVVAVGSRREIVKVRLLYEYPPAFSGPLAHLWRSLVGPGVGFGALRSLGGPGAMVLTGYDVDE